MAILTINGALPSVNDLRTTAPKRATILGTVVFDDITFPAGTYINNNGDAVNYPELFLLSVQVVVNSQKNIIETPVAGLNGTVKEYISRGDYMISISGKITQSAVNAFPADDIDNFVEISEIEDAIPIESKLLNEFFNVFNVVLKKVSVSTIPGSINEVDVTIEAVSDIEIDLNNFLL
jgi:hypothetical protein